MQPCGKINDLLSDLGQAPETFTGRFLYVAMFNDISCNRKGNKDECLANARVVKVLARRCGIGQWSFIGPGSGKKWYILQRTVYKEFGIISRKKCSWNSQKADILLSVQRLHCPEVFSKAKDMEKLSIHFAADELTIETVFCIIISVNQLSIYGAVAAICEEFENHQDGSGEPEILIGQSIVLDEIKAEAPFAERKPFESSNSMATVHGTN